MVLGTPGQGGTGNGLYFRFPPVHEFHGLKMLVPPTSEPLTVDDIRQQVRADTTLEDAKIASYIQAAREYCEGETWRLCRPQTWVLALDRWPRVDHIQIPIGPVSSILSVTYQDSSGATTVMTEGVDYFVDLIPRLARIVLPYSHIWPPVVLTTSSPIQVTFRVGYPYFSSTAIVNGVNVIRTGGSPFDASFAGFPVVIDGTTTIGVIDSVNPPTSLELADDLGSFASTTIGYDGVPERVRQAMRLLCGHWFQNREAVVIGRASTISSEVQLGVARLLASEEVHRF